VLRDLITIQREEFIRWLSTASFLPKTAAPSPGDYLQVYEELASTGVLEIISIHMSAKVSAAFESASTAAAMLKERLPRVRVEVIDSRNAALCQGWMAVLAARQAMAGASLQAISESVRKLVPISHMIQTGDSLRYLYLGGRIGKAKSLLGSLLQIKPLIGLEDGEIVALGKTHSRGQAYEAMAEMVAAAIGNGKARIGYVHAGALQEVLKVRDLVEAKVQVVESMVSEFTPALAVYTGPGTTGLCYYKVEEAQ
jgi:DegV family protein with EDD domain